MQIKLSGCIVLVLGVKIYALSGEIPQGFLHPKIAVCKAFSHRKILLTLLVCVFP